LETVALDQYEKAESAESKSSCIACKLPLHDEAHLCPECGSYQRLWKNQVLYWSRVIGIAGAIIAIATYVTATLPRVRVLLFPRDIVQLISFHDYGYITVHNAGDRDIFVTHIYFESREPKPRRRTKGLYKVISPGGFMVVEGKTRYKPGSWVTTYSKEEWNRLLQNIDKDKCYEMAFFSVDDPTYKMISEHHEALGVTFFVLEYDGRLYYKVAGSLERRVFEFKAVAGIRELNIPECD
jgi:hypothetical protein